MEVRPTSLDGVIELQPARHGDSRGWFSETWNANAARRADIDIDWVQDNESFSKQQGTLRGIHFQTDPHAQDKLVRVVAGSILDVAVDLRRSSPTYRQHVAVKLDAQRGNQLLVPKGFGHGFVTLEPDCQIAYKVSDFYNAECDRSLLWNDPNIGVDWGIASPELSQKDRSARTLEELEAELPA